MWYIVVGLIWTMSVEFMNEAYFTNPVRLDMISRIISVLIWPIGMIIFFWAFFNNIK